ncbi:ATP-binding cassette, subfamily B/ATP-binding cassette, subfamily B, MsbA [Neorhodopirellula lusitana]|uniref:ATP-binding cassette, subfamily B/ATP-binding cassette, subfamily B, MsbA n=1 Tax=Neorhodopirellula lusitana TaxID=445327 RepID=A0ABY1QEW7_9BACT|nr:ABC transporter ATP-binding protein [Neorhodopirellula lusitana]SMP69410.1 ATP-binding cassette, subfamily B/ATP-binding cassette, subfamily B, MsbA [Neorhodopirellula lusitana]
MKSFRRVLRLAARRRWSLLGVLLTSLVIAGMWGGNIGTLYPMVEVVFEGHDLKTYLTQRLEQSDQEIIELNSAIQGLAADETVQKTKLEFQKSTAEYSTDWLRKIQPTVNNWAPTGPFNTLLMVVGILIGGTAIKLVALTINLMLVQYIAEGTVMELREKFFRKALQLDLDHFGENGSANLTSRLTNDVSHIGMGLSTLIGRLIREPLKMLVCLGGAAMVCPRLLLLVMVVSPIVAVVMSRLSKSIRRASRRVMEEMSNLYGMLNDAFNGIRVVRSFNTQAHERARFRQHVQGYYRRSMKVAFYNTAARGTSELLGLSVVGLAIIAGGYLTINQQTHLLGIRMSDRPLDDGKVLLFFAFLIGASDPAKKLSDVWSALQRGIAASTRVYEIIDEPIRVNEPAIAKTVARPHQELRFDDVHFQYSHGPSVLRGIDLTVAQGETIALVGPNGCGKSTLISLLCRFDDPRQGQIRLDGVPIAEMATRDLRKRIALVTQRTVLFDDTIENNIRYGSPSADSHDVVRAAKLAFADDFILRKTPHGYQSLLGSGGVRLSGGQMQRIALARAFLRNPDILILDEATSQVDIESEQLIHDALEKFLIDRTGIMVTHRSSTLALANRVAVLDQGQVSAVGTHEQLLAKNGFYRNLCHTAMSDTETKNAA